MNTFSMSHFQIINCMMQNSNMLTPIDIDTICGHPRRSHIKGFTVRLNLRTQAFLSALSWRRDNRGRYGYPCGSRARAMLGLAGWVAGRTHLWLLCLRETTAAVRDAHHLLLLLDHINDEVGK